VWMRRKRAATFWVEDVHAILLGSTMLWEWAGKHLIGKVRTRMGRGTSDAWGRHHRRDQGKATLHHRRGQVDACAGLVPRPSVLAFLQAIAGRERRGGLPG
jgi:hypothetical protein